MSEDNENWHMEFCRKAATEACKELADDLDDGASALVMSARCGAHTVVVRATDVGFALWAVGEGGPPDEREKWLSERIGYLDWPALGLLVKAKAAIDALAASVRSTK